MVIFPTPIYQYCYDLPLIINSWGWDDVRLAKKNNYHVYVLTKAIVCDIDISLNFAELQFSQLASFSNIIDYNNLHFDKLREFDWLSLFKQLCANSVIVDWFFNNNGMGHLKLETRLFEMKTIFTAISDILFVYDFGVNFLFDNDMGFIYNYIGLDFNFHFFYKNIFNQNSITCINFFDFFNNNQLIQENFTKPYLSTINKHDLIQVPNLMFDSYYTYHTTNYWLSVLSKHYYTQQSYLFFEELKCPRYVYNFRRVIRWKACTSWPLCELLEKYEMTDCLEKNSRVWENVWHFWHCRTSFFNFQFKWNSTLSTSNIDDIYALKSSVNNRMAHLPKTHYIWDTSSLLIKNLFWFSLLYYYYA